MKWTTRIKRALSWFCPPYRSPIVDHAGKRSWTAFAMLACLALGLSLAVVWLARPDLVAEELAGYVERIFFATVVVYFGRRWTQSREAGNGAKRSEDMDPDE